MAGFENELLVLLSDVARHMRAYGNQLARQHGVTLAQVTILGRLEREPDISQNELAAITELSPMTVEHVVDRLQELGLVNRCADPKDRHMWRLRLTPAAAPPFLVGTKGIDASVLGTMARSLQQMKENVSNERLISASG
jgi:MarR family